MRIYIPLSRLSRHASVQGYRAIAKSPVCMLKWEGTKWEGTKGEDTKWENTEQEDTKWEGTQWDDTKWADTKQAEQPPTLQLEFCEHNAQIGNLADYNIEAFLYLTDVTISWCAHK